MRPRLACGCILFCPTHTGRDFYPKDANHQRATSERPNSLTSFRPRRSFCGGFGNAPGVHGPDVLSIGRDGRFTEWDTKARSAERSVGPSMVASGSLKLEELQAYVAREMIGRLPPELGYHALRELEEHGNYNVCTVGTPMLTTVIGNYTEGQIQWSPEAVTMLAKFDPVRYRDYWLRSFLDYVRSSDPERISPSVRPHYAQAKTSSMIEAYMLGLANEVRPTGEADRVDGRAA